MNRALTVWSTYLVKFDISDGSPFRYFHLVLDIKLTSWQLDRECYSLCNHSEHGTFSVPWSFVYHVKYH